MGLGNGADCRGNVPSCQSLGCHGEASGSAEIRIGLLAVLEVSDSQGEEVLGLVGMDALEGHPVAGDVSGGDEITEVVVGSQLEAGDGWGLGVDIWLAVAAVLEVVSHLEIRGRQRMAHPPGGAPAGLAGVEEDETGAGVAVLEELCGKGAGYAGADDHDIGGRGEVGGCAVAEEGGGVAVPEGGGAAGGREVGLAFAEGRGCHFGGLVMGRVCDVMGEVGG
jgi:hypothetical protein